MLLAARDATGGQRARDIIERASRTWGRPKAAIRQIGGTLGSWEGPAGLQADYEDGWVAEGGVDFGGADLSPSSLQLVRGDFALFVLNHSGVLLASGRAGGYRPVYVAWPGPELVIACTHLSPLLDLLPQRPPLDLDHLSASLLIYGPKCPESTPYAGIRRVPTGESWLVRPGAHPQRWSTVAPLLDGELRDDGDLANLLRRAITEATRRSTQNAARLAVEVSGGLDSSMLLSVLVSLARTGEIALPPAAITYESEAPPWHDDRPHLRSLEDHVDLRVHRVTPTDASASVGQLMVIDAMPAPWPMLSAAKTTGRVARAQGVDVVLVGEGGDQVLDGNPRLFGELARKGEIGRGLDGALRTRGAIYQGPVERLARFFLTLLNPLLPRSVLRGLRRLRRRSPRWVGADLVRHMDFFEEPAEPPATLSESPGERYARLTRWPSFSRWSLMRLQEELVGGYTLRAPLLDDDLLRFAATLPPLSLMQGGFLRGLMREAMRGLVPEDLRLRETKGTSYFFTEQTLAMAGGLDVLAGLADVRMLADLGLVEPRQFREFFDGFRGSNDPDATYDDLWRVLSVEAFLRQHAGESPVRPA